MIMFRFLKRKKALILIRNIVIVEVVAFGLFVLLALPFYWAHMYRQTFPWLERHIPFNVIELSSLAIFQILLIVFVVMRSVREETDIHDLTKKGEHEQLEFKSTFRWDVNRNQVNKDMERNIMKTIAAFMNTNGGSLVIGVDDQRKVIGIRADVDSLIRKDVDGFENHFNNVFSAMIGPEFRRHVQLSFHDMSGEQVCLVSVDRARQPAYVKSGNGEDFFIRTGNATTSLKVSQATAYVADWHQR